MGAPSAMSFSSDRSGRRGRGSTSSPACCRLVARIASSVTCGRRALFCIREDVDEVINEAVDSTAGRRRRDGTKVATREQWGSRQRDVLELELPVVPDYGDWMVPIRRTT
jgi:hypothetical protein